MLASLRRSASASAAIATNSLPRWLISMTDMPAWCQLTSSHFAFSSTSTGIVAGPAPKLKMRAAGLICAAATIVISLGGGFVARSRPGGIRGLGRSGGVCVAALAVLLGVHDALQAAELLAVVQVDERDTLRGAAHLADLVHARADEHAARGDEHDLVLGRHEGRGDHLAVALGGLDRDHALRAAAVAGVLRDRRALAVAVLGRGE